MDYKIILQAKDHIGIGFQFIVNSYKNHNSLIINAFPTAILMNIDGPKTLRVFGWMAHASGIIKALYDLQGLLDDHL